jgi:hypothetical protein
MKKPRDATFARTRAAQELYKSVRPNHLTELELGSASNATRIYFHPYGKTLGSNPKTNRIESARGGRQATAPLVQVRKLGE